MCKTDPQSVTLDPFYLIVDHADWIERLVPEGVKLVQLRIKEKPEAEIRSQIRAAQALCRQHNCTLVINDYWRLAIDEGCDWLHLGQEDLAEADMAAIKSGNLKLGLSSHDGAELKTALAAEPDYVALGPVFATILKKMPWAPQGLEKLLVWKKALGDMPLVGIGGLTPQRAQDVLRAGADSAAVVTDILLAQDPHARTRQWLEATQDWR